MARRNEKRLSRCGIRGIPKKVLKSAVPSFRLSVQTTRRRFSRWRRHCRTIDRRVVPVDGATSTNAAGRYFKLASLGPTMSTSLRSSPHNVGNQAAMSAFLVTGCAAIYTGCLDGGFVGFSKHQHERCLFLAGHLKLDPTQTDLCILRFSAIRRASSPCRPDF